VNTAKLILAVFWVGYLLFTAACLRWLVQFHRDYARDIETERLVRAREEEWRELRGKLKR